MPLLSVRYPALPVAANLGLAGVYFVEPWRFGRVVDALAARTTVNTARGGYCASCRRAPAACLACGSGFCASTWQHRHATHQQGAG